MDQYLGLEVGRLDEASPPTMPALGSECDLARRCLVAASKEDVRLILLMGCQRAAESLEMSKKSLDDST